MWCSHRLFLVFIAYVWKIRNRTAGIAKKAIASHPQLARIDFFLCSGCLSACFLNLKAA
jgi:hypothetical protein